MTRTDCVIAASGIVVRDDVRAALDIEATRHSHMSGGRYSDHLRLELATYAAVGPDRYLALHVAATRQARGLGY